VLVGTLYPLVVDAISGEAISVGPPYFNLVVGALFLPLLVIVPFGPRLAWKRADIAQAATQLWVAAGVAIAVGIAVLAFQGKGPWLASVGIALGAWLICGALSDLAERAKLFRVSLGTSLTRLAGLPGAVWGSAMAHAGVGVTVLGIVAATAWADESIKAMRPGDVTDVGPYHVTLVETGVVRGANFTADQAVLKIERGGAGVLTMTPQRRFFPVSRTTTTETAIHTTGFSDLYAALGERMEDGTAWTVRLHYRPLAPFIWLGALLMAIGGALSLADRRLRIGAPSRRAVPVAAE
jgi:cytochrome c-type biogenesis protein CcmF